MDKAVDEPDRSAGCFFAYRVSDESVHGTVGKPSQAEAAAGKTLLDLCVNELAQQLTEALTEATPLEHAGLTPPPF
jgi:creatinine amidohydrolase